MSTATETDEFKKNKNKLLAFIYTLTKEDRIIGIRHLLNLLNFEHRLAELTDEERDAMNDNSLSLESIQKINDARTQGERMELTTSYARATYIKRCAWIDYLNGLTDKKPFISSPKN